jgi:ABC-type dipeptide/oligopeptide/nickel transport system ATPase subunit
MGIRASARGLEIVDYARKKKGWTKTMTVTWWQNALTTQATLKRFWRREAIREENFMNICKAVGLNNWQEIADISVLDEPETPQMAIIDWGEAPDVYAFYGRQQEQETLKQWIITENCRLVALFGIGGIGKTALAATLADSFQEEFQYIIWRSLRYASPADKILADLINFLEQQQPSHVANPHPEEGGTISDSLESLLSQLMSYLHKQRCLLVLDGFETVLKSGDLAGNYRSGYEIFGKLIHRVAQERHHSCLLLTSREKPKEIAFLEGENIPVRSLNLAGLSKTEAQEIFRAKCLEDERIWFKIIEIYGTNPLVLQIIAAAIKESFNGKAIEFLRQNTIFLGYISDIIEQQFERLSTLEQQIMFTLAANRQPLSLSQIRESVAVPVSGSELISALVSLGRRSLIEKIPESDEVIYTLQPVIMKYVSQRFGA